MKTFAAQLEELRNNALAYIRKVLNQRGTNYELTDPANYEDEIEDCVFELPRATYVNKYSFFDEYPIIAVDIDNDVLTFQGIAAIGEADDDRTFNEDDMTTASLCGIADIIANLEFQSAHG